MTTRPISSLTDEELAHLIQQAARHENAPSAVINNASTLFASRRVSPLRQAVNRIVALLTFDSEAMLTPAMGVRALPSSTRQMLYSAEGFDIDLRITAEAGRWVVRGQLLGPDSAGGVALTGQAGSERGDITSFNEFALAPVPPGTYTLTLTHAGQQIVIPGLALGAAHA